MKRLHTAHTGIDSTLRRARECVYWPGLSADLKDYMSRCDACNTYAIAQPKEPHPNPWQKVGCDIFTVSLSITSLDEAEVKEKVGIRSYRIMTDSGRELRRNRRHLRKTSAHSTSEIPEPNADDQASEWFVDSGQLNTHATPMTTPANPPEQPLRRSHRQQRQPQFSGSKKKKKKEGPLP